MNKSNRSASFGFRPLRTIVACVLIIVLCLSLSIGMGYSRYLIKAESGTATFDAQYINLKNNNNNIQYAFRNKRGVTEITSKDGNIKVTIPEDAYSFLTSDNTVHIDKTPKAYVLYTRCVDKTYDDVSEVYNLQYDIRLYAVFESTDHYGYANSVESADNIILEINSDEDYVNSIVDNSPSAYARTPVSFDNSAKIFVFEYEMLNTDIIDISYKNSISTGDEAP